MNLAPLFALQSCLHATAAAGCALIGEDFRLARALDDMQELEAASPVFAKLAKLVRSLLDPACPDPVQCLLDALTLADALVCTQATAAATGPVEPLVTAEPGPIPGNLLHSTLVPLLDALDGKGGQQQALDMLRAHPDLASNFRVQPLLVRALGSAWYPLAEQAEHMLASARPGIVPLLLEGFDAAGPKERLRRLSLVDAKAAAKANDFYLACLDKAPADRLRLALIYALRHDPANIPRLVELARKGRGQAKLVALHILADMESPAAADCLREQARKDACVVCESLQFAQSEQASTLLADIFAAWLDSLQEEPATGGKDNAAGKKRFALRKIRPGYLVAVLFNALPGKKADVLCPLFRRLASLGTSLDEEFAVATGWQPLSRASLPFSRAVAAYLREAILVEASESLIDLALELARAGHRSFVAPAITGLLATRSSAEAAQVAEQLLAPQGFARLALSVQDQDLVLEGLDPLLDSAELDPAGLSPEKDCREDGPARCCFVRRWHDAIINFNDSTIHERTFVRPFADTRIDGRWLAALLRQGDLPADPDGFKRIPGNSGQKPLPSRSRRPPNREQRARHLLRLLMGDMHFDVFCKSPQDFLRKIGTVQEPAGTTASPLGTALQALSSRLFGQ